MIAAREKDSIPSNTCQWPNKNIFACVNTAAVGASIKAKDYGDGPLPIGIPFEFESDLFHGKCLFRIRDVDAVEDKSGAYEKYFDKRRRKWQIVVQGKFKEELPTSELAQGSEFARPWTNMPPDIVLKTGEKILKTMSPHGSDNDFTSDTPRVMSCMSSNIRVMRKDEEGEEPDIMSLEIDEDCSKFGGKFSLAKEKGKTVSVGKRKKYLCDPKNGFKFDTEHVYTFSYHDHLLDIANNKIDIYGLAKIDMGEIWDGQPMNCTTKTTDGRYFASFQFWHKNHFAKAVQAK